MSTNTELQQFLLNPFEWYRVQREISPVSHSQTNGIWSVFGYEDVQRTLSDYTNFSSALAMGGADVTFVARIPETCSGLSHSRLASST